MMKKWILVGIFLSSIFLFGYALFKILWAEYSVNQTIEKWDRQIQVEQREFQEEIRAENLIGDREPEPELNKPVQGEKKKPIMGDVVGKLEIDRLQRTLPILQGSDTLILEKGVGHLPESVLPGEIGNSVLAGHRDTVFRGLGKLKKGDVVTIETRDGNFQYEIIGYKIVDQDYRGIRLAHDKQMLTMITCYPFDFIGPAPKRYILTAKLK